MLRQICLSVRLSHSCNCVKRLNATFIFGPGNWFLIAMNVVLVLVLVLILLVVVIRFSKL